MSHYELTEAEGKLLRSVSIERVINTSLTCLENNKVEKDLVDNNLEDWYEVKELVVKLWDRERSKNLKCILEKNNG